MLLGGPKMRLSWARAATPLVLLVVALRGDVVAARCGCGQYREREGGPKTFGRYSLGCAGESGFGTDDVIKNHRGARTFSVPEGSLSLSVLEEKAMFEEVTGRKQQSPSTCIYRALIDVKLLGEGAVATDTALASGGSVTPGAAAPGESSSSAPWPIPLPLLGRKEDASVTPATQLPKGTEVIGFRGSNPEGRSTGNYFTPDSETSTESKRTLVALLKKETIFYCILPGTDASIVDEDAIARAKEKAQLEADMAAEDKADAEELAALKPDGGTNTIYWVVAGFMVFSILATITFSFAHVDKDEDEEDGTEMEGLDEQG